MLTAQLTLEKSASSESSSSCIPQLSVICRKSSILICVPRQCLLKSGRAHALSLPSSDKSAHLGGFIDDQAVSVPHTLPAPVTSYILNSLRSLNALLFALPILPARCSLTHAQLEEHSEARSTTLKR